MAQVAKILSELSTRIHQILGRALIQVDVSHIRSFDAFMQNHSRK